MKRIAPALLLLTALACQPPVEYAQLEDPLSDLLDENLKPFYYGVASGDPLQDAVILWTKVSPEDSIPEATVCYELAEDEDFKKVVYSGCTETGPEDGYTVKVDADGLEAGTRYFYRFKYEEEYSVIGRTMTAPKGQVESLKFGVVSCSNYEFGPFNAYGAMADREDLNAVIHLGDYIYEYGPRLYGDTTTGRFHEPAHEIISLSDYRTRYAQYRTDKDLRDAHGAHPFITIWDDHEIANDAYKDGAQNHSDPREGSYMTRKEIATQVYYEWMPVRESEQLYRSFDFGDLAELIVLDERLAGRTEPVDSVNHPNINDDSRAMLGQVQQDWFNGKLRNSGAKWKIIGNQVIFSYLDWGWPGFRINTDSWDGYPRERTEIIDNIRDNGIENVVFVTGDTHTAWALEVTEDPTGDYKANGAVAVEFGATSINSGNSNERRGNTDEIVIAHEKNLMKLKENPHLRYTNMRDHGYMELSLDGEKALARWFFTPDRRVASREMVLGRELITPIGSNRIIEPN